MTFGLFIFLCLCLTAMLLVPVLRVLADAGRLGNSLTHQDAQPDVKIGSAGHKPPADVLGTVRVNALDHPTLLKPALRQLFWPDRPQAIAGQIGKDFLPSKGLSPAKQMSPRPCACKGCCLCARVHMPMQASPVPSLLIAVRLDGLMQTICRLPALIGRLPVTSAVR